MPRGDDDGRQSPRAPRAARVVLVPALAAVAVACAEPPAPAPEPAPEAPGVVLHEWGFVEVRGDREGDTVLAHAWLHLHAGDDATPPTRVAVRAAATHDPSDVGEAWDDVVARPGGCDGSRPVAMEPPPIDALPGAPAVGDCVHTARGDARALEYFVGFPRARLPIGADLDADRARADAPVLLHARDRGRGLLTRQVTTPGAPDAMSLGAEPAPLGSDVQLAAFFARATQLGISSDELDALADAVRASMLDDAAPSDAVYYWLDPSVVEAAVPLDVTPAAAEVHRVWLVRVVRAHGGGYGPAAPEPGGPRVRLDTADAVGPLEPALLGRVIGEHRDEVRACYAPALATEPELAGHVSFAFDVAADGTTATAHVVSTNLERLDVERCIARTIDSWVFPASAGGEATHVRAMRFVLEP